MAVKFNSNLVVVLKVKSSIADFIFGDEGWMGEINLKLLPGCKGKVDRAKALEMLSSVMGRIQIAPYGGDKSAAMEKGRVIDLWETHVPEALSELEVSDSYTFTVGNDLKHPHFHIHVRLENRSKEV